MMKYQLPYFHGMVEHQYDEIPITLLSWNGGTPI